MSKEKSKGKGKGNNDNLPPIPTEFTEVSGVSEFSELNESNGSNESEVNPPDIDQLFTPIKARTQGPSGERTEEGLAPKSPMDLERTPESPHHLSQLGQRPQHTTMRISLIVAMGKNFGIGLRQNLPWRLPNDLRRFKELTLGHHLIMGRKTFESIGRPLPLRDSIVITRNPKYSHPEAGVFITHSLEEALLLAKRRGETEVFICGGGHIYQEALPYIQRMYLTLVDYEGAADTYFPRFDHMGWHQVHEESWPVEKRETHSSTFKILDRADTLVRNPVLDFLDEELDERI